MEGQYPETSGTGEASWEPDSYSPPPGSAQNRPYTAGRFAWQDAVDAAYGISRPRGISSVMHGAKGGASKPQEPWARAYSEVSAPRRQPLATPARTSKETPDAGKERDREHDTRFGFRLPDNFESLMRMSPRQRDRARRDAREDGVLSSKLAKLAAGENVGFTLGEKRRLGEAGGHVPRPRWAAEQDRVRAGSPDLASMGKHRLGDLSESRIGMQTTESKNQQPPWAQALIQELRRQTTFDGRTVELLEKLANMVGVK